MESNEREARRKRQRELRRKQIRNHLIILCCVIAAGVIAAVILIGGAGQKSNDAVTAGENALSAEMKEKSSERNTDEEQMAEDAASGEEAFAGMNDAAESNDAAGPDDAAEAQNTSEAAGTEAAAPEAGANTQTALFNPELANVTAEDLPNKVAETAAKIPECYTGELLPPASPAGTDRSAEFSLQPGVPCGADPAEGEKVVYLTLDDGPSANTITALNILDHYGIKATFFVTGLNPEYHYLIKEAYDRGHTIGLHTNSHDYASIYASVDNYYADLNAIGQAVSDQIGFVPCFIRFPGGSSNYISHDYTDGIMTVLTADIGNYGYQYFDWNASSGDGAETENPALLADAAVSYDYYDTIVLLSHDGSSKEPTMQALPFIIEYYMAKGYEFRPITRNAYPAHHSVEN